MKNLLFTIQFEEDTLIACIHSGCTHCQRKDTVGHNTFRIGS